MPSRTKRLTALTTDQATLLPAIRDEWMAVGLSTIPADRVAAEEGVKLAYRAAGLDPPRIIIWLNSPMAGAIGAAMLASDQVGAQVWDQVGAQVWGAQVRAQVWAQVWDQVWAQVRDQVRDQVGAQVRDQVRDQVRAQVRDQVRDQVGAQVWAQVRDQVGAQVRAQVRAQVGAQVRDQVGAQVRAQVGDQVGAQVRAQVRDQVRDQVWAQVWDQVGAQVWAQVRDQVGAQVNRCGYGLHDASWVGFYRAFGHYGLSDVVAPLAGITSIAQSCGWWWPFTGAVILTERPVRLRRDAQGRLHDETGMALAYPDGWGVYAWHGVRIPPSVIEQPRAITSQQIQAETNAEIRRVMIERFGWDRWLAETGAHPVQSDRFGALYRTELGGERIGVVVVTNSTPEPDGHLKKYALLVPPEHETAHAAVAATFGLTAEQYQPAVES